jgi:chromosomal replication initiator protein
MKANDDSTNMKQQWDKVLEKIATKINKPTYEAWVKPTFPISMENNVLTISTPNDFAKDWLDARYKEHFRDAIKEVSEATVEIDFIVQEQEVTLPEDKVKKEVTKKAPVSTNNGYYNNLNAKYTFNSFVIGNHNRFANAAAQRVAESPGHAYNPLFIYGGVGLGKTHLMHSIGNQMIANNKDTKVAYLSSERFTNELINSIKDDKMIEFRNRYRSTDLLLIDDIQFLEGKERTQEEFFHTFNALYDEGKQIVISSDRLPKDINMLEDRLRSRFEMGLLTDVQPPDFETRIAILKKKSEIENMNVSDDVLHYIANAFKDNVRELEGAFIRVMAYASLTNIPTTVNLARTILGREPSKELTLEGIQKAVASFYGIEVEDLISNIKTKEITWARHVAMYIARDMTKFALQRISLAFGRKDHTTVIHAFEKVKNLAQNDPELNSDIQKIIDTID